MKPSGEKVKIIVPNLAVGKIVQWNGRDVVVIGPHAHRMVGEHPHAVLIFGVKTVLDNFEVQPNTGSTECYEDRNERPAHQGGAWYLVTHRTCTQSHNA